MKLAELKRLYLQILWTPAFQPRKKVTKKKKVFNNTNKVVFCSISTSESRNLKMMVPERSNQRTNKVKYNSKREEYEPAMKIKEIYTESELLNQVRYWKKNCRRRKCFWTWKNREAQLKSIWTRPSTRCHYGSVLDMIGPLLLQFSHPGLGIWRNSYLDLFDQFCWCQ